MLKKLFRGLRAISPRAILYAVFAFLMACAPAGALAAGGEGVSLRFTTADMIYLYVSLGFGLIAIAAAWLIRGGVLAQSPGNEKMQEVGAAIRSGALAYLARQFKTMLIFVLLLAALLIFIFQHKGWNIAIWTAVCFIGGVAASYIAGYAGMIMAVAANMRTAHAALTSPKQALETGFRSGAVAGLLTVGMGLIGATLIFLFFRNDAMKLLVGFGFGGSLAALFMRVGGGIYTKAADVGADLVGKVEAGIPEDDPRNPATIADNVGDNVGDCAGMAADIFESYEVTLVAAIVLGAATAAIFDQATWMKLILFALMARGVGIVASIIGILFVRGSDDVDKDALIPLRKGFFASAVVAAVGTAFLAWFLLGRPGSEVQTTRLVNLEEYRNEEFSKIRKVRDEIAKEKKIPSWQVTFDMMKADKRIKDDLGLDKPEDASAIQAGMSAPPEGMPAPKKYQGFSKVDFSDTSNPVLSYTVPKQPEPGQTMSQITYASVGEQYSDKDPAKRQFLFKVKLVRKESKSPEGQTIPAMEREGWFGPYTEAFIGKQIEQAKSLNLTVDILEKAPIVLYSNSAGELAMGVSADIPNPHRSLMGAFVGGSYYKESKDVIDKLMKERQSDFNKPVPPDHQIPIAIAEHTPVPWWLFFLAVLFGIFMAFAIEMLTDYYVSTHKRPVRDVAGVSTTGPAPMIITGFALAKESSVFSVFAIVVALMVPLYLFNPATYGTTILSFYGIALVGLGLLTTTGYILAMDTFGPVSDNAQGVFQMSGAEHESPIGSKAVQRLDAAGNTTKALTKGFAIATAVVAAVALFHSYIEDAQLTVAGLKLEVPEIFLGLLIGGAAPFLFSAFSINAVGRAAFYLINEVRRQFKADPGIMAGTSKPDYGRCVAIVTEAAQKELIGPGILAIALPMAVAFGFSIGKEPVNIGGNLYNLTGAQALGGFLAGAILSGQLMAVLLANSGGIWDNAKKLIEDGMYGGKGSEAHKAGVVVDTVGDPFKDTAGPALNPLIKVMNLVALLLAGVVIQPLPDSVLSVVTAACVLALAFSIWWSKRSSMSSELGAISAGAQPSASLPTGSGEGGS